MIGDAAFAVILYVVISLIFNRPFEWFVLGFTLFATFSPDLDFILFALLRKKFKLVSHRLVHYPLLFVPLGTTIVYAVGGFYFAALFFGGALTHFIRDSMGIVGIRWSWPFSNTPYVVRRWKIGMATEHQPLLDRLAVSREHRTIWDEITLRLAMEVPGRGTLLLIALATLSFLWYLMK